MSSSPPYAEPLLDESGSGGGYLDTVAFDAVGAGVDMTRQVPGQAIERPRSLVVRLVTDATVGNRFVEVRYEDGNGGVFGLEGAALAIAASQDLLLAFNASRGSSERVAGSSLLSRLPDGFLSPGHLLRVHVVGVQAGDQLSAGRLLVERYSTDPAILRRGKERRRLGGG